jgi:hypothetical protein
MPEDTIINDEGLALHEQWDFYYWLFSIIKIANQDIDKAKTEAEQLAITASGSLLVDPSTGKRDRHLGGLVDDITRVGFSHASAQVLDADLSLFGAGVRVKVKMTNEEVD